MPADIEIRAKYQGQAVTSGLKKIEDGTKSIQGAFSNLKTVTLGILGAGGIEGAIRSVGQGLSNLMTEQRQSARLFKAIETAGRDARVEFGRINDITTRLRDNSFFDDVEIQRGLSTLIQLTNDYEASMRQLPLVLDIAEARQISVEESARKMSFAMAGIAEPLGEVLPQLRGMNAELATLSQSDRAEKIIGLLSGTFAGDRKAGLDSAAGAWERIGKGIAEVGEALLEIPLEKLNALASIGSSGGEKASIFSRAAESIRGRSFDDLVEQQVIPPEVRPAFGVFKKSIDRVSQELDRLAGRVGFGGFGALSQQLTGATVPNAHTSAFPFVGPIQTDAMRQQALLDDMLRQADARTAANRLARLEPSRQTGPRISDSDSLNRLMSMFGDPAEGGGFAQKLAEQFRANQEAIGAPIQAAIKGALEAGARDGLPGMARSIGETLFSVVLDAVSMALTNAIVPGGGLAGGLLGSLTSLFGGGAPGGIATGAARNQAWRVGRPIGF